MKGLSELNTYLLRFCRLALIFMVPLMVGIIFVQVIFRYCLASSLSWAEELSKYLLVWISCLGSANGIKEGMHVSIDYIKNKLPVSASRIAHLLIHAITIGFFVFCIIEGSRYAIHGWDQKSTAMEIRMTIPYLALPVGFLIMLSVSIELLVTDVQNLLKK
jgi:TRAP-type C4-dicarboxylate transport system permease small subunit